MQVAQDNDSSRYSSTEFSHLATSNKTNYNLEDLEMEIGHAVIRVNKHHKHNKNISEVSNYLFESIKNVFKAQHEKDYEDGFIDTNPEMALFGDFAQVFNLGN